MNTAKYCSMEKLIFWEEKMKLILAGFNVDVNILNSNSEIRNREDVTPETISAAYARISRSPKSVTELREISRHEIEKARKSNESIIFKMGHHSVAEHAVFNFDLIDISRIAIEFVEHFRLCSYTEKSQRYVKLNDDYIVPDEIIGTNYEKEFRQLVQKQNEAYNFYYKALRQLWEKKYQGTLSPKEVTRTAKLKANEDARYALPLATAGQLGMTVNARNLELLIRRFASSENKEIQQLSKKLYDTSKKIAPSIIIFTESNPFDMNVYNDLSRFSQNLFNIQEKESEKNRTEKLVTLLDYTANADNIILASILHRVSKLSFNNSLNLVETMATEQKREFILTAFQHVELFDTVIREFEFVNLSWDLILSSSCFAQMKRHRMSSISPQDYSPMLAVTIPPAIKELNLSEKFINDLRPLENMFYKLNNEIPAAAPYILTNSHRRRVHFSCNLREFYHISRLREDAHAQWDIRSIVKEMHQQISKIMPLSTLFLCGKDDYPQKFKELFGKYPKVVEAKLPGST